MTGALALLLVAACWLERVRGEPEPLDPRFYADVEQAQGEPGVGGGDAIPFNAHEGPKVTVRGEVVAERPSAVDIDVRVPDPTKPGGVDGQGKIMLDGPGPFELAVPRGLGALELQAFQDPDGDGPSGDDPFAQVNLEVGETDQEGVRLELVPGARGQGAGPVHHEMPPGAPGGGTPGGATGPTGPAPFADYQGRSVTVSGQVAWGDPEALVDLDLFQPDARAPGGRRMLGKVKVRPGAYDFDVPVDFGPLIIEAFVDLDNNGPSAGDPMGIYAANPLVVEGRDLSGVDIALVVQPDGRMPGTQPAGQPAPPPRQPGI